MSDLILEGCVPCQSGTPPLTNEEIQGYLKEVPEWEVVEIGGTKHLKRQFSFDDFAEALDFTNIIGCIAEEQDHHPLIELTWGRVTIQWWTHKINGLHRNDFIMAAKTSNAYEDF